MGKGAQFAIDTTVVSPMRMDGSPRRQCATTDGVAMAQEFTLGSACLRSRRKLVVTPVRGAVARLTVNSLSIADPSNF